MKKAEKFVNGVTEILRDQGACQTDSPGRTIYPGQNYQVETKAGTLNVMIGNNREDKNPDFLTIFCKFDEPEKAAKLLPNDMRLNQHSGKWNYHYGKKVALRDALVDFEHALNMITPDKPAPAKSVVVHLQSFRVEVPGCLNSAQIEAAVKKAVKSHSPVMEDWEVEEE